MKSRKILLSIVLTAGFIVGFQFLTYDQVNYSHETIKEIYQKTVNLAKYQKKKVWDYYDLSDIPEEKGKFFF